MRSHALAALLALLAVPAALAADGFQRPANGDCIALSTGSDVALFPEQYMMVGDEQAKDGFVTQVNSSRGFSVQYFPSYKVVTNSIAGETYVLSQCGAQVPPASQFPEGTKFFTVPLVSLSAPETVPYAFVDFLGLTDRVHDVSPFVSAPCGQALLECPGGDSRISPDAMQLTNGTYLEAAVGATTDGLMATSALPDYPESFAVSAAQDPGVLNRAEWVKFVGLFFNQERAASDIFAAIKAEYEATKASATSGAAKKPVVAWASHFAYPGMSENYGISFAEYKKEFTQDAGGAMLDREAVSGIKGVQAIDTAAEFLTFTWDGSEGSFPTQAEAKAAFLEALKKADVIIDETYAENPTTYDSAALLKDWGLTEAEAATLPAWANKKVFRPDGLLSLQRVPDFTDPSKTVDQYGSDWFEGAIARPGKVLKDIVRAVQGQGQGFTWVRNLFTEQPVVTDGKTCNAAQPCAAQPRTICPFVKECPVGQAPALLMSSSNSCTYAECGKASALEQPADGSSSSLPTNAAAMAAPAIVLTLIVVAFVEVLMHFC
ncbi:flagellar associated [Chlorella sorokiniana]|uniref:Flagellar associated n=1 Tax=Chlorella sorokiniana TaxID=3076 RepID=A0A2P6TSC1_CHLSO|nr:flagellar associated [Chlorella sorokiniana]|eukprot:PRW56963.1 flagellar associated [Chlorella sorokiniana]